MARGTKGRRWSREDTRLHKERAEARALLMSGENVSKTAEKVGVSRVTVHRWLHEDEFAVVKEHRETELARETAEAVRSIIPQALECVVEAIASGDAKIALQFAEKVGALSAGAKGNGMAPEVTATPQGVQIVIQQYGDNAQNVPKGVDNAQDVEAEVLD